nr:MAG TPA: hypothetical protein [Caudoviricetes sp.]
MERLTFEGNFCEIAQCRELPCKYGGNCSQKQAWERLKQFEDAVQTPEKAAWAKKTIEMAFSDDTSEVERLRELYKADKEGRVLILPCKVGDTVYAADAAPVIPLRVKELAFYLKGEDGGDYERVSNIGKTVFLTREEAEKALQEMEGKKDG